MSARIAAQHGPLRRLRAEPRALPRRHRASTPPRVDQIDRGPGRARSSSTPPRAAWADALALGTEHGYRNAQVTVLAPTGTIGFMMDCDTTGIEPDIALVKYKKLVGGGMLKIVNNTVPLALQRLGYSPARSAPILQYIDEMETIEGAPGLRDEHLPVFDCAFKPPERRALHPLHGPHPDDGRGPALPLRRHLQDRQHAQRAPRSRTSSTAYLEAWKLGLKAIAIYRDGCKRSQPLNTGKEAEAKARGGAAPRRRPSLQRRRLPDERRAITHKFSIGGHEGYITVGMYDDGTPGELFVVMAKEGSVVSGLMDSFATVHLLALQYGVPLKVLVRQVQPHPLRALGLHRQPGHPHRQVDHRLHLPLAVAEVPPQRGRAGRGQGPSAGRRAGGPAPAAARARLGHGGAARRRSSPLPAPRRTRPTSPRPTRRPAPTAAASRCATAPATSA